MEIPFTNFFLFFKDCLNTCGLKICSEKCQITHQRHDNEECSLVKRVKDKNFDQWLSVIRVLKLRKSNPKLWTSFNMLEDHREDRKECLIMKQNKSSNVFIRSNNQIRICNESIFKFTVRLRTSEASKNRDWWAFLVFFVVHLSSNCFSGAFLSFLEVMYRTRATITRSWLETALEY